MPACHEATETGTGSDGGGANDALVQGGDRDTGAEAAVPTEAREAGDDGAATDPNCGAAIVDPPCSPSALDAHYACWIRRIATSPASSDDVLTNDPDYAAIVGAGACALPYVFSRMESGNDLMMSAAEKITGVDVYAALRATRAAPISASNPLVSAQEMTAAWLAWWRAQDAGSSLVTDGGSGD
jgi:hypothetical protein